MRVRGYILTKLPHSQPEWPSGAPHWSANPGSVSEPWASIQGSSCASRIVCLSRFKPLPGWRTKGLIWALLFCGCGSSNLEPPDHRTAVANHHLRRLFFWGGGKWGLYGKPTTCFVNLYGRPLIVWPTISSKWPHGWCHRIWVEIQ